MVSETQNFLLLKDVTSKTGPVSHFFSSQWPSERFQSFALFPRLSYGKSENRALQYEVGVFHTMFAWILRFYLFLSCYNYPAQTDLKVSRELWGTDWKLPDHRQTQVNLCYIGAPSSSKLKLTRLLHPNIVRPVMD